MSKNKIAAKHPSIPHEHLILISPNHSYIIKVCMFTQFSLQTRHKHQLMWQTLALLFKAHLVSPLESKNPHKNFYL